MPLSILVRLTSVATSSAPEPMPTRKRATTPARPRNADATATPAYFLSLTVENVRCFGPAQRLDLSDGNGRPVQWTIILGDNGVGKTTLLLSLIALLPTEPADERVESKLLEPQYVADSIDPNRRPFAKWHPLRVGDRVLHFDGGLPEHFKNDAAVRKTKGAVGFMLHGTFLTNTRLVNSSGGGRMEFLVTETKNTGLFTYYGTEYPRIFTCFSYGAARRASSTSLSGKEDHDAHSSLFSNDVTLINAEEWLLRADYAASKASSIKSFATKRRDHIKSTLLRIFPEGEIKDIRFGEISKDNLKPHVEFDTSYGWVRLQELSLGYKTLIAWIVDFASRMFDRYPDSPNPLAEPAVCLVDEIDLHLHPTWQRKLIGYLTELFPNTQFIVTAHSPLVVQAATDANIVVLRREGDHVVIDNSVESLKGWSVDQILTSDLYGLVSERPPEYDDVLAERQRILSKSELTTKDKRRLRTLEAKVDELPVGATPQDIKAFDLVRRFAADLESKGKGSVVADDRVKGKAGSKRDVKGMPRKKAAAKVGAKGAQRAKNAKR